MATYVCLRLVAACLTSNTTRMSAYVRHLVPRLVKSHETPFMELATSFFCFCFCFSGRRSILLARTLLDNIERMLCGAVKMCSDLSPYMQ